MSRKFLIWVAAILAIGSALLGMGYCEIRKVRDLDTLEQSIVEKFRDVEHISPAELARLLESHGENLLLIDCRNPEEYAVSRIPGAVNRVDTGSVRTALAERNAAPEKIAVYCSVGYRSARLARALSQAGIENVVNVRGSIFAWANEDRPLETPDGEPASTVHPYNPFWGRLLNEEKRANLSAQPESE